MAGLYIHIPYCKTRCIYCDFYTQTNLTSIDHLVDAICKEIELRKNYISTKDLNSIYFGGGTPSLLSSKDFNKIFDCIEKHFRFSNHTEITIEANPDDLSKEYLTTLTQLPINRLSIGIQSFDNIELKFLNRRHNAQQAIKAVQQAQDLGFNNMSIDLMYGLPNQSLETWENNITTAISLDVNHISSYHLIYEEGTKLFRLLKKNEVRETDEETSLMMFSKLINMLGEIGYEHYEISNFARNKKFSQHNTAYWLGKPYLGIGPSAHSYDGKCRAFNIPSINKYVTSISNSILPLETEHLTNDEKYNELILTSLRCMWGLNLNELIKNFDEEYYNYCLNLAKKYIEQETLLLENNHLKLTKKGIFISDSIMSDLMKI